MSRILICLSMAMVLLGCGREGNDGGDSKKAGSAEQNASKSQAKSDSGSANSEVTIDARGQEKAGIQVAQIQPRAVPEFLPPLARS